MPESSSHIALKQLFVTKLKTWFGASLGEYPSSGHNLDVIAVTKSGISIYVEIIWSHSKIQFLSDINMLQQSDADVKLVIASPSIIANKERVREFEKVVIAERKKRKAIHGSLLDGRRILDDSEFVDHGLRKLIDDLTSQVPKRALRERRLSKFVDETLLLNANIFYVTEAYTKMVSRGIIAPGNLQGLHDQMRRTLSAKSEFLNQIEMSKVGTEVKALLGIGEDRDGTHCSVWPDGNALSGFLRFAIINGTPIGAVLTGSIQDLIFVLRVAGKTLANGGHVETDEGCDTMVIYMPPGFMVSGEWSPEIMAPDYVEHTPVRRASRFDLFGPRWSVVCASFDTSYNNRFVRITTYKDFCYVRIKGVIAPAVAGTYFFKIALSKSGVTNEVQGSPLGEGPPSEQQASHFIPSEDWPVMLVQGEVTPATIVGTIRYGDFNRTLVNQPVKMPGRVYAKMIVRINPYTGASRPDLPIVHAVTYFNGAAEGRYKLHGLAPGVYDLYASAAGYPEVTIRRAVRVMGGQTLHFDGNLQLGTVIHGDVFSKDKSGDAPWTEDAVVKIELFDGPTLNHVPDPSAGLISWSGGYVGEITRAQNVGPPQEWSVHRGDTRPFHFEFGIKGEYGAPRDLDGMVPQVYAAWVNGLTPGRYYARPRVINYEQSGTDGSTFQEYYFDVEPNKWGGEVKLAIDLRSVSRGN